MDNDKNKIVVLAQNSLNKRVMNTLRLDELERFFNIEYWDVSALLFAIPKKSPDVIVRKWARSIESYSKLRKCLNKIPANTIVIICMFKQYSTYRIHKLVGDCKSVSCAIIPMDNSMFWRDCADGHTLLDEEPNRTPTIPQPKTFIKSCILEFKHVLYHIEPIAIASKYIRFHGDFRYKQWLDAKYYQKCINSYKKVYNVGMDRNADYTTCSPQFDEILRFEDESVDLQNPYIVFMDSYYPLHLDLVNRVPNFDWNGLQKLYYDSMNSFFDKIEKEYNCDVVIAAHPNAQYAENPFRHRRCIKYNSVKLVKKAMAVMLHATGSVLFVAYYNKPFCFLTNDALKAGDFPNCPYRPTLKMASVLQMPLVDTDRINSVKGIFHQLNPELRTCFLDLYFGDYTTRKPYAEQLKEAIVDIYNRINQ